MAELDGPDEETTLGHASFAYPSHLPDADLSHLRGTRGPFQRFTWESLGYSADPNRSRQLIQGAQLAEGADSQDARVRVLEYLELHGSSLADRSTLPGHLTGSALVIEEGTERFLLMLHTKLGRWLQPGGHADGDHDLAHVALREATEETGISGLSLIAPAVDLDIHKIPPSASMPEHLHLDLRFVVIAPLGSKAIGNSESMDLQWVDQDRLGDLTDEAGLVRLVDRGLTAYRRFVA